LSFSTSHNCLRQPSPGCLCRLPVYHRGDQEECPDLEEGAHQGRRAMGAQRAWIRIRKICLIHFLPEIIHGIQTSPCKMRRVHFGFLWGIPVIGLSALSCSATHPGTARGSAQVRAGIGHILLPGCILAWLNTGPLGLTRKVRRSPI
jgi:hypothetical protein